MMNSGLKEYISSDQINFREILTHSLTKISLWNDFFLIM